MLSGTNLIPFSTSFVAPPFPYRINGIANFNDVVRTMNAIVTCHDYYNAIHSPSTSKNTRTLVLHTTTDDTTIPKSDISLEDIGHIIILDHKSYDSTSDKAEFIGLYYFSRKNGTKQSFIVSTDEERRKSIVAQLEPIHSMFNINNKVATPKNTDDYIMSFRSLCRSLFPSNKFTMKDDGFPKLQSMLDLVLTEKTKEIVNNQMVDTVDTQAVTQTLENLMIDVVEPTTTVIQVDKEITLQIPTVTETETTSIASTISMQEDEEEGDDEEDEEDSAMSDDNNEGEVVEISSSMETEVIMSDEPVTTTTEDDEAPIIKRKEFFETFPDGSIARLLPEARIPIFTAAKHLSAMGITVDKVFTPTMSVQTVTDNDDKIVGAISIQTYYGAMIPSMTFEGLLSKELSKTHILPRKFTHGSKAGELAIPLHCDNMYMTHLFTPISFADVRYHYPPIPPEETDLIAHMPLKNAAGFVCSHDAPLTGNISDVVTVLPHFKFNPKDRSGLTIKSLLRTDENVYKREKPIPNPYYSNNIRSLMSTPLGNPCKFQRIGDDSEEKKNDGNVAPEEKKHSGNVTYYGTSDEQLNQLAIKCFDFIVSHEKVDVTKFKKSDDSEEVPHLFHVMPLKIPVTNGWMTNERSRSPTIDLPALVVIDYIHYLITLIIPQCGEYGKIEYFNIPQIMAPMSGFKTRARHLYVMQEKYDMQEKKDSEQSLKIGSLIKEMMDREAETVGGKLMSLLHDLLVQRRVSVLDYPYDPMRNMAYFYSLQKSGDASRYLNGDCWILSVLHTDFTTSLPEPTKDAPIPKYVTRTNGYAAFHVQIMMMTALNIKHTGIEDIRVGRYFGIADYITQFSNHFQTAYNFVCERSPISSYNFNAIRDSWEIPDILRFSGLAYDVKEEKKSRRASYLVTFTLDEIIELHQLKDKAKKQERTNLRQLFVKELEPLMNIRREMMKEDSDNYLYEDIAEQQRLKLKEIIEQFIDNWEKNNPNLSLRNFPAIYPSAVTDNDNLMRARISALLHYICQSMLYEVYRKPAIKRKREGVVDEYEVMAYVGSCGDARRLFSSCMEKFAELMNN